MPGAHINDLLFQSGNYTHVNQAKLGLFAADGPTQDDVYNALDGRSIGHFNDALKSAYFPLYAFDWKAAFYAEDPGFVPPADGDPVPAWKVSGSTRTEGAYLSGGLVLPGTSGNYASVPDSAALDITGDITFVTKVTLDDWTPTGGTALASKVGLASTAYALLLNANGTLSVLTTADGSTQITGTSTVATGVADGASKWVAATLDVDNGASGRDYTFWLSDDGESWTQLGATVTEGATTSIVSNAALFNAGGVLAQGAFQLFGSVQVSRLYSGSAFTTAGPGGSKVLDIDFTGRADTNKFECSTGQTVTVHNSRDASQATGSKQPAYRASVAALNGRPAVQGDGVDDFLQTAAWDSALSQPNSVVIVGNVGATSDLSFFDGLGANRQRIENAGGKTIIRAGSSVGSTAATTSPALYVAVFGATDTLDRNGTQIASGDAGAASLGAITIGAYSSTLAGCHTGHYAFVGAIAGDITAEANWSRFTAWVESHYGLTVA